MLILIDNFFQQIILNLTKSSITFLYEFNNLFYVNYYYIKDNVYLVYHIIDYTHSKNWTINAHSYKYSHGFEKYSWDVRIYIKKSNNLYKNIKKLIITT